MIQRIQSIYLLIAGAAMGLLQGLPYFSIGSDEYFAKEDNVSMAFSILPVAVFILAIFLFKNRSLQARVTRAGILFAFAFIGYALYQLFEGGMDEFKFAIGGLLPVASILLGILALMRINADEKLVQSSRSRLR